MFQVRRIKETARKSHSVGMSFPVLKAFLLGTQAVIRFWSECLLWGSSLEELYTSYALREQLLETFFITRKSKV